MQRRHFLLSLSALTLPMMGCRSLNDLTVNTAKTDNSVQQQLNRIIPAWEKRLDAKIGVSITNSATLQHASYRGSEQFPFNSTIKTFIVANFLQLVDSNQRSLNKQVDIKQSDLLEYAPVCKIFFDANESMTFEQLCAAAITMSDNTAANLILVELGGLAVFNQFLQSIGLANTVAGHDEPLLNEAKYGDVVDTTQPVEYATGLQSLMTQTVLSTESKQRLLDWMRQNKVADGLFRRHLPANWQIADRTGAGSNGSRNIIAVVWNEKQVSYFISLFIVETSASFSDRNEAIARIGEQLYPYLG